MKMMKVYQNLHINVVFFLLAHVFEKFRNRSLQNHGLCFSHCLSAPSLCWYAMVCIDKVELVLILDSVLYFFYEIRMKGGVSCIYKKYSKENKYLTSNNPKRPTKYITYFTKTIYTVMLCQNLFQRAYLSGWILQNLNITI